MQVGPARRSLRILVIDEHTPSVIVLCSELERRGHLCRAAGIGTDAVGVVASFRPQVVFYEWNLRQQIGLGLARKLREVAPSMLIVTLSTCDEPADFLQREQVDAYLVKPFRVEILEGVLAGKLEEGSG